MLLLDEPFSGLDRPGSERLEGLIATLAGEGRGIVIATHDLEQARRWDSVLCLNRAQIAVGPPGRVLDLAVLEATYGGAIVEIPGIGRARDPAAPPSPPLMLEPLQERVHAAGDRRDRADRRSPRGALGCWVVLYGSPTRPSRSPTRSSPGW